MLSKINALFVALLVSPLVLMGQSIRLADSLASIGSKAYDRGNYRDAEFYQSEALKIFDQVAIQDTSRYIDFMFDYSYTLHRRAKYNDAMSQLNKVSPILSHTGDTTLIAKEQNYRGSILKAQNRFEEALNRYNNARELASLSHDSLMLAIINDNMGGLYRLQGKYKQSLDHRNTALELFEKVGTEENRAITLNNIGLTYINLSMYDRAYDYLSRSLAMSKNLNDNARLTTAYANLGLVHFHLGNYDQTLMAYQRALESAHATGMPLKQADILNNLGNLYSRLGDPQKSLDYYRESLDILLSHDITSPSELSTKYKNIATRQADLGELENASENYRKALELRRETGNTREITLSLLDMAQSEYRRNELNSAYQYALRGKQIADSLQISRLINEAHKVMGHIQWSMGNNREAVNEYRNAYRESRELSEADRLAPLMYLANRFNEMESDSAVYYGEQLVDIIERNRGNAGELSIHRSGYFEEYSDFYVNLASWNIKYRNDIERAFNLVEASKARALLDELMQASQNLDELLPVETRLQKQQMIDEIESYQSRLDTANEEQQSELRKQLRNAELDYAAFMNRIREENPEYKELNYPAPISAEGAQALLDDQTAIIEYAFTGDDLIIFMITSDDLQVKQVNIAEKGQDSERLTKLVEQFRDQILAHAPEENIRKESSELFRYLINPFSDELSGFSNVMIIPDEVLAYLPFEALTHNGRYLIERYNIKYAPSLTTFSILKNKNQNDISHSSELLAIAGSNFGGTSSAINRGEAYPPLPATLAEVDSIAARFNHATVFKEGNFSEEFIKENLKKNYRYVHLATHGIIDESFPNLSGLALSSPPDEASGREDGMLRSSEIYQLNINSDMVVLSACNTGLGKMVKGEGMLGLQRSFFYAGVPTVSVSLWNVYDRSTAFFMDQFYGYLLEVIETSQSDWSWNSLLRWVGWDKSIPFGNAAPAMRKAKLEMLDHPLFHHPIYWAPFIVVGR